MSISCVIGTYGGDEWIELARRAAASAEGQGFHEIIHSHLPRGSLAQARNAGAEQATGKWLLFLDGDDELDPNFGAAMRKEMRGARKKMLFTPSVQYVSARREAFAPKIWPRTDFKNGNWCVIATVINRSFFLELKGFKEWELYEDWALWATADREGAEVVEVPNAIYIAHMKNDSRNRAPGPQERLYWHQEIGHDVWPEIYDEPTFSERQTMHLRSRSLRRIG